MEIDRKELKRQARQAMGATNPKFWLVTLVFLLMTGGVAAILNTISFPVNKSGFSSMGLFVSILYGLYSAVVSFGFTLWALWTSRKLDPGLNSLIQGFSVAGKVILMEANIYLRVVMWSMLVSFVLSFLLMPIMGWFAMAAGVIATLVVMVVISMKYALSPYLLADNPDAGSGAALRRSSALMEGWKMEYFKLELSFAGWLILAALLEIAVSAFFLSQSGMLDFSYLQSVGGVADLYAAANASILSSIVSMVITLPINLWVMPYMRVANAAFYDARLRHQFESAPTL